MKTQHGARDFLLGGRTLEEAYDLAWEAKTLERTFYGDSTAEADSKPERFIELTSNSTDFASLEHYIRKLDAQISKAFGLYIAPGQFGGLTLKAKPVDKNSDFVLRSQGWVTADSDDMPSFYYTMHNPKVVEYHD